MDHVEIHAFMIRPPGVSSKRTVSDSKVKLGKCLKMSMQHKLSALMPIVELIEVEKVVFNISN